MNSKLILFLLIISLTSNYLFATHNRGGRIEVKHVHDYLYEITITTYTKASSYLADRPQLDSVYLGDSNIPMIFNRDTSVLMPNDMKINIYSEIHYYPGNGVYKIHFADPNRDANIVNIPNSVSVPFYVETVFTIDLPNCPDFSPHLYTSPNVFAQVGKDFVMSRAAEDENWDSLSFELDECYSSESQVIVGYTIPSGVSVNPITGDFLWDGSSMIGPGEYNFAIRTKEWRNGVMIGYVHEDFQVILSATTDTLFNFNTAILPPDLTSHITPGPPFTLHVEYIDSSSVPYFDYYSDLSTFTYNVTSGTHIYSADITFTPTLSDIRPEPYRLQFRGKTDLTYLIYVDGSSIYICRNVEIDEIKKESFNIYPNPTTGILYLKSESFINDLSFTIFDLHGKIVKSNQISYDRIDVSELSSGIYFIELTWEYVARKRFVLID